jgi:hypothetical protein
MELNVWTSVNRVGCWVYRKQRRRPHFCFWCNLAIMVIVLVTVGECMWGPTIGGDVVRSAARAVM